MRTSRVASWAKPKDLAPMSPPPGTAAFAPRPAASFPPSLPPLSRSPFPFPPHPSAASSSSPYEPLPFGHPFCPESLPFRPALAFLAALRCSPYFPAFEGLATSAALFPFPLSLPPGAGDGLAALEKEGYALSSPPSSAGDGTGGGGGTRGPGPGVFDFPSGACAAGTPSMSVTSPSDDPCPEKSERSESTDGVGAPASDGGGTISSSSPLPSSEEDEDDVCFAAPPCGWRLEDFTFPRFFSLEPVFPFLREGVSSWSGSSSASSSSSSSAGALLFFVIWRALPRGPLARGGCGSSSESSSSSSSSLSPWLAVVPRLRRCRRRPLKLSGVA
jgi:hypothetical protein